MSKMESLTVEQATRALANAISQSDEYLAYAALKDAVMSNDTNKALLHEYQKLQTMLQMAAMAGKETSEEDVQRFTQLSSLLYMNTEVSQYLLAQMRLQRMVGETLQTITKAAGIDLELPGMET